MLGSFKEKARSSLQVIGAGVHNLRQVRSKLSGVAAQSFRATARLAQDPSSTMAAQASAGEQLCVHVPSLPHHD